MNAGKIRINKIDVVSIFIHFIVVSFMAFNAYVENDEQFININLISLFLFFFLFVIRFFIVYFLDNKKNKYDFLQSLGCDKNAQISNIILLIYLFVIVCLIPYLLKLKYNEDLLKYNYIFGLVLLFSGFGVLYQILFFFIKDNRLAKNVAVGLFFPYVFLVKFFLFSIRLSMIEIVVFLFSIIFLIYLFLRGSRGRK